jgi:hypothetical protein
MNVADKFVITQETIGKRIEIEIDDVRFCELYDAKEVLSAAFSLEEKYELLLMNFLEFEKEILSNTAEYFLFDHKEYSDFFDIRLKINQRVVNFLTSCRLYVDHAKSHIKTCLPNTLFVRDKVDRLFNDEFDQYFEYRFCEKLRNHVQHQSLAVHSVNQDSRWQRDQRVETTKVYAFKAELEDSKSFSKKYLAELPDKIELISVFKKYIELLSKIQSKIRILIKEYVDLSRDLIEGCIAEYSNQNDSDVIGLAAIYFKCDDENNLNKHKKVPLLLEWDNVRIKLESKNRKLVKFSHRKIETVDEKPDVLQNRIRNVAQVTRDVIEGIPKDKRDVGLEYFPEGACGHASVIVGQCLMDFLNIEFDYFAGSFQNVDSYQSHAWLQNKDFIVDITADQFDDVDIKVWVTTNSKWHQDLLGKPIHKATLEEYDRGAMIPLAPFYEQIKEMITSELVKLNFKNG